MLFSHTHPAHSYAPSDMVIASFSIRVVTTRSIYIETWVHDLNLVFYTLGYWMLLPKANPWFPP